LGDPPAETPNTWDPPQPPGYLASIQTLGNVVAPLLAGAAFTMTALMFPALGKPNEAFAKWPEAPLALFVTAAVCMIGAVQAALWARRYECTPEELRQWYPEHFGGDGRKPDAWVRAVQSNLRKEAYPWAARARHFFHGGILCLFLGIAVVSHPPAQMNVGRAVLVVVAWAAVLGEVLWILHAAFLSRARRDAALADAAIILAAVAAGSVLLLALAGEVSDSAAARALCVALAVAAAAEAIRLWLGAQAFDTATEVYPASIMPFLRPILSGFNGVAMALLLLGLAVMCVDAGAWAATWLARAALAEAGALHLVWLTLLLHREQHD
jgi:hypothetical protein